VPNGMIGGYGMATSDFRTMLERFADDELVAHVLRDDPNVPGRIERPSVELNITCREGKALLDRHKQDTLPIVWHEGDWYLVQINIPNAEVLKDFRLHGSWLGVSPKSPLFAELRSRHKEQLRG
jgi:hypothetical protein